MLRNGNKFTTGALACVRAAACRQPAALRTSNTANLRHCTLQLRHADETLVGLKPREQDLLVKGKRI